MGRGGYPGLWLCLVAGHGKRNDPWRPGLLSLWPERCQRSFAGLFTGLEPAAWVSRIARDVAVHPVSCSRRPLAELLSFEPHLCSAQSEFVGNVAVEPWIFADVAAV